MSEMALTADHVIVVGRGRLLRDQSMAQFIADASTDLVRVRSPQARQLAGILAGDGVTVRNVADGVLEVEGLSSERIGTAAAAAALTLYELAPQGASLEEAYMSLTEDSVDYRSSADRPRSTDSGAVAA
jgi:ABC-2 type transport system ATP-binding protein